MDDQGTVRCGPDATPRGKRSLAIIEHPCRHRFTIDGARRDSRAAARSARHQSGSDGGDLGTSLHTMDQPAREKYRRAHTDRGATERLLLRLEKTGLGAFESSMALVR